MSGYGPGVCGNAQKFENRPGILANPGLFLSEKYWYSGSVERRSALLAVSDLNLMHRAFSFVPSVLVAACRRRHRDCDQKDKQD